MRHLQGLLHSDWWCPQLRNPVVRLGELKEIQCRYYNYVGSWFISLQLVQAFVVKHLIMLQAIDRHKLLTYAVQVFARSIQAQNKCKVPVLMLLGTH